VCRSRHIYGFYERHIRATAGDIADGTFWGASAISSVETVEERGFLDGEQVGFDVVAALAPVSASCQVTS
jgi:hypothetical protein